MRGSRGRQGQARLWIELCLAVGVSRAFTTRLDLGVLSHPPKLTPFASRLNARDCFINFYLAQTQVQDSSYRANLSLGQLVVLTKYVMDNSHEY